MVAKWVEQFWQSAKEVIGQDNSIYTAAMHCGIVNESFIFQCTILYRFVIIERVTPANFVVLGSFETSFNSFPDFVGVSFSTNRSCEDITDIGFDDVPRLDSIGRIVLRFHFQFCTRVLDVSI